MRGADMLTLSSCQQLITSSARTSAHGKPSKKLDSWTAVYQVMWMGTCMTKSCIHGRGRMSRFKLKEQCVGTCMNNHACSNKHVGACMHDHACVLHQECTRDHACAHEHACNGNSEHQAKRDKLGIQLPIILVHAFPCLRQKKASPTTAAQPG